MKKELFFMCTAAMLGTVCFTNLTADKASAKTSGDYRYVVTGKKQKTCAIRKYLGKDKDVVVPDRIDGYVVTRIGKQAFRKNKNIQSVTIPRYVTIISEKAFSGCSNLESISLPQKVHTINKSAFYSCKKLKSINLPAKLKKIGKTAFYNCPLDELKIPRYVESIGTNAFASGINTITVDANNKKYDSRKDCNALIETSSNTLLIGTNTTIIPDGITAVGDNAFSHCGKMKEITIPASVKKIGYNAFYNCLLLEKVNFSEGLISIGDRAFEDCKALKNIKLPDSLETIGTSAFLTCEKLVSINIPKNLKKTDFYKIFDSNTITTITVAEGNKTYDSRDNCNAVIETATNKLVFATANSTIPEGVTSIKTKAFKNLEDLEEITIPSSVTMIDDYAFSGCINLGKVNLSEGLTEIGDMAFFECSSLAEINLPDSLETIGNSAFFECENLDSIYIPKNLKKTDLSAIFDSGSVTKISVAAGNKFYDSRNNCNAVIEKDTDTMVLACESTVIPNTVKVIGEAAFMSVPSTLVVPEGVEKILDFGINGQGDLVKVTLPASLTSIGKEAFGVTLTTINYAGSKAQWDKIKIDLDETKDTKDKDSEDTSEDDDPNNSNWLTDVKINYDYKK